MPGTFRELDVYFKSEEEKVRSPKFRAERIRTFLREYHKCHRDEKVLPVHFLFEEFIKGYKGCKESNFIAITKKTYPTSSKSGELTVDLSMQRKVRTRKSE
jgi:hypothetical protein